MMMIFMMMMAMITCTQEMHQLGDVVGTLSILEVIVSKVVLLGRYGGILLHTVVLVFFEFFA